MLRVGSQLIRRSSGLQSCVSVSSASLVQHKESLLTSSVSKQFFSTSHRVSQSPDSHSSSHKKILQHIDESALHDAFPEPLNGSKSQTATQEDASVVIFDKDGTLICFHSMWTPWALETAEKIEIASGLGSRDIAQEVYRLLGFCPESQKVRPGLLAEATMPEIKGKLVELLVIHGMELHEAEMVINSVWQDCNTSSDDTLKSLHNLKHLFETLQSHGVQVAVCTADSRQGTEGALTRLGLRDLVDIVVCGDDKGAKPKPSPYNALKICEKLGVDPKDAFMVGDTLADMGMGRSAKLGGTIGVLSGVCTADDLQPHADHLVDDVGSLLPIVLKQRKESRAKKLKTGISLARAPAQQHLSSLKRQPRPHHQHHAHAYSYAGDVPSSFGADTRVTRSRDVWRRVRSVPGGKNRHGARSLHTCLQGLHIDARNLHTTSAVNDSYPLKTQFKRRIDGLSVDGKGEFGDITHIVIGAGSAGCVMANRLTEDPDNQVLLVEAGPKDEWYNWKIHMPAALMYNLCDNKYNWYYHTLAQKHMDDRVMYWPRGRVWGGSSSLNAMAYVRGHAADYDRWQNEGCDGWDYQSCLPYFKKAQKHNLGGDDYRGGDGPLGVTQGPCENPLFQAWNQAGVEAGYGYTADMNGYRQEGVGPMDMTIWKGKRMSASQAYLWPIVNRPNLHFLNQVYVTKLILDRNRAIGIEYIKADRNKLGQPGFEVTTPEKSKVYCESDVVLCGGAINSPQLLMLSGIGPADHLIHHELEVKHNLPGVGQNLQDHLEIYVQQACTQPITLYNKSSWKFPHNMIRIGLQWFLNQTGEGATSHLEAGGFVRSDTDQTHPNVQFHFLPSTVHDHGRVNGDQHAYQVHVGPMRPTSRGYLKLHTNNVLHAPILQPNYLETEFDRKEFRECIRISRDIFAQKAFEPFRGVELAPGVDCHSDDDLDAFVRAKADSAYHPSCTCKMGSETDQMAVVDPKTMKVHGMEGLRIVDSSVMPSIVSGNLNAPTIMLAEKAADLVRHRTPLPKANVKVWSTPSNTVKAGS